MKKENKLIVLKSLIIAVFLILGNTALAQHPLLGPDELHVYAFPHQLQVTIGKQANDEGRTCYKWRGYFGENGIEERIGSKQVFDLPSYMSSAGSSYEFELTVIGEQYYQQTVELHIVEEITFQVQPKKGCFSGNEIPVKEDFEITTSPSGYENLVSIDYDRCHQYEDGMYLVFFKLVVSGVIMDSHTVFVRNTGIEMLHNSTTHSVEQAGDLIRGIVKVTNYVAKVFRSEIDPPTIYGGWTITEGYDCCDKTMRQKRLDVNELGGKAGFHVNLGNPIPVYGFYLGFRGWFEFELGLRNLHVNLYRTCSPFDEYLEGGFHGAVDLSIGVFIEDFTGGALLSATGSLGSKFSLDDLKTIVTGSNAYTDGKLRVEMYAQCEFVLLSWVKQKYRTPLIKPIDIPLRFDLPFYD